MSPDEILRPTRYERLLNRFFGQAGYVTKEGIKNMGVIAVTAGGMQILCAGVDAQNWNWARVGLSVMTAGGLAMAYFPTQAHAARAQQVQEAYLSLEKDINKYRLAESLLQTDKKWRMLVALSLSASIAMSSISASGQLYAATHTSKLAEKIILSTR